LIGSPDVEVGDVYKVPLKASAKKDIMVNAVESIYNGAPYKVPPQQHPEVPAVEG
jgi:hypothetical protein